MSEGQGHAGVGPILGPLNCVVLFVWPLSPAFVLVTCLPGSLTGSVSFSPSAPTFQPHKLLFSSFPSHDGMG